MADDIRNTISLLFISVLIVGIFAFVGLSFLKSVNDARILSAQAEWRTEALMLANRIVSDPNCFGYSKILINYNADGDYLVNSIVNPPMTVDYNKLFLNGNININRVNNCIRLLTPEYKMLIGVSVIETPPGSSPKRHSVVYNIDYDKYYNDETAETVSLPVRIISDEGFSYGLVTITISVNGEYLGAKLL